MQRNRQLTYSNLVTKAIEHWKHFKLSSNTTLKDVVCHMLNTTHWIPSHTMIKRGVSKFYERDFQCRIKSDMAIILDA